ncbi:MAG: hypothetical protein HGA82_03450, partial [Anaerolineales bacterium]|nr:hypothetical protein [Anaerolineales bacterium]
ERVGNKVPHPAIMFLALVVGVIVLSQVLAWIGVSATYEVIEPPAQPADAAGLAVIGSPCPLMLPERIKQFS